MKRVAQLIEEGDLVFDIGANEGGKTDELLRLGARVICVEPQPDCAYILRKKYQNNPDVKVVEKGMADREGWMELSICSSANTLSTFSENWKKGRFSKCQWNKTIDVEVTTLDRLIEIYGFPKYCKIDVEGFEFEVIRGLSKPIPFLSFEFTKEFIATAEKTILHLQQIGYVKFNVILSEGKEFILNNWTNSEELLDKLVQHEDDLLWGDIYARMQTEFTVGKDLVATARLSDHLTDENSECVSLCSPAETKNDFFDWICKSGFWHEEIPLRLHLGCGEQHLEGYINIDFPLSEQTVQEQPAADVFLDFTLLEFPTQTVDEIRLHHAFEHFERAQAIALLVKWHQWLKVGGKLHIETPDIIGCAEALVTNQPYGDKQAILRHAFGSQEAHWASHLDGWYAEKFQHILSRFGFKTQCRRKRRPVPPYLTDVEAIAIKKSHWKESELLNEAAELLKDSLVSDAPSELRMHQVWCDQLKHLINKSDVRSKSAESKPHAKTPVAVRAEKLHRDISNLIVVNDCPAVDHLGYDDDRMTENGELDSASQIIKPADVVFDVGANKGAWCEMVLGINRDVTIFAFEPIPRAFESLKGGLNYPNVELHNLAVSEADKEQIFYHYSRNHQVEEMSSFYRRSNVEKKLNISPSSVSVRCVSLDSFCSKRGIPKINFLKIDTEGSELDVLQGAKSMLRSRKIDAVQFEYGGTFIDAGISLKQIFKFLSCFGYRLFRIIPKGLIHISEWRDALETYRYANYVAIAAEEVTRRVQECLNCSRADEAVYVVFSKDRAMQLDAAISSLRLHCADSQRFPVKVIYKTSSPIHRKQYTELQHTYPEVEFIAENNFKQDLIAAICKYTFVVFLVDDNLFVRKFHLSKFIDALKKQTDALGFSLRLGKNTQYCYMHDRWQQLPEFKSISNDINTFKWVHAECDFAYPLELSSSIYRIEEILPILKALNYENPNNLESLLHENRFQFGEKSVRLLCCSTSIAFCNPINKVQNVCASNRAGENPLYTMEKLSELFGRSYRIDIAELHGFVPNGCHQEVALKMKKPEGAPLKVSVVIPCFNYGKYLRAAVESVIGQTFQKFEIIIVNDGSTDNTKEVAETLINQYPEYRIRLLNQENSGHPAISRNNGITIAKGEYILPLDADDKLHPKALENYYNKIKEYGLNPVVAYGWLQSFGTDESLWAAGEFNPHSMLRRGQVPSSSMYHRSVWELQGGYRLNGFEDWDFWIGAIRIGAKFCSVGQITTYYRKTKNTSFIDEAVLKHEWYVAKIIKNNEEIYENIEFEWADDYLSRNPEPPTKREIHGSNDRFPLVGALLVASHPERYTEEEGSWAADYLKQHPFSFTKKLENCMAKQPEAATLSITAVIAAYNEGDIIYHVIRDYVEQGIQVYFIDHHSTDNTVAEASKWLGKGLIQIERFPEDASVEIANDAYAWRYMLRRKEQIASAMGPGWYIHADADEFREAPWINLNLREGIERADREGFNAINFKIYDFKPTDNNFTPGEDVREYLKCYDPDIHEFNHVQIKCWKNYGQKFTMWQSGGHSVEFEGRKVYPIPFILRHYAIRSQIHGEKKVFAERKTRFDKEERAAKWHNQYDEIKDHSFQFIRNRTELILFERDKVCHQILEQKEDSASSAAGYYEFLRPEIQLMVDKRAKKILDVGCATGKMAAALKQKFSAEVWGIELVDEVAREASKHLDKVISGDIETALSELPDAYFDTIIFADVLEHLEDPYSVLRKIKSKLDPGGQIIASIPNVRHWSVLKDLIEGKWAYKDAGILDKTHLRFFTRNSVIEMFQNAGFNILDIQATTLGDQSAPEKIVRALYQVGLEVSSLKEDSRHYQYLVKAVARQVSTDVQLSQPLVSIIILTCNQLEFTKKCLDSIFKHTKTSCELIVVDNGSTDDTVQYLEALVKEKQAEIIIKVVQNETNLGFAAGNNQGIAAASGDYVLLMNNDIVVTPSWLTHLISCAEQDQKIGIVGPVSNYVSGPQLVKDVTYNTENLDGLNDFASELSNKHSGKATPFWRVVGFCMLIKRAVIDKIGGMDTRYGLGNFEDDDFSLRAILAGYESRIAEDCFVHHFGNRTFIAARIDYRKSLKNNWDIFKEKWGIPKNVPYGSSYDLSFLLKDGFIHSKHYASIGEITGLETSNAKETPPNSIQENYFEIQELIATGKKQEAKEALEKLLLDDPEFELAHNDLGVLYFQAGDKAKALRHYERAVALQPVNVTFLKNLADFYYVESGRVEDALQIYVNILTAHPEDVETLLITGHICVALEKFQDAKIFYSRVLEIEPGHQDALQFLDKLHLMNTGNFEAKTSEELYRQVQPLLNNGDPHKAIAALTILLERFSDFALAYNDLGVLYYCTGEKEKAQHHYEHAVELMPENINFQKNLADYYLIELDRKEDALQIYLSLLNHHPNDLETNLTAAHICVAVQNFSKAKVLYKRVLVIDSENEDARNNLRLLENIKGGLRTGEQPNTESLEKSTSEECCPAKETIGVKDTPEKDNPQFSIIMLTAAPLKQIRRCVESIKKHTSESHEILFVNNGTTKGVSKWVRQCIDENHNCRLVKCGKGANPAVCYNTGIKAARGEYIVLLSNDVVVTDGWLSSMLRCFNSIPDAGLVSTMTNRAKGRQKVAAAVNTSFTEINAFAESYRATNRYRRIVCDILDGFCLLFRRDLTEKIGLFDEQMGALGFEDEDFCLRATLEGYVNQIAGDVYLHRLEHKAPARSKKNFNLKWGGADVQSPTGKCHLVLKAIEKANRAAEEGKIDLAAELFLQAIGLLPEDRESYYKLAEMLVNTKRFQGALDVLNELPEGDVDARQLELAACCKEGLDLLEEAEGYADQALELNRFGTSALNTKGIIAFRRDDKNTAELYFTRAMETDPGFGEAYTNLGALKWVAGLKDEALSLYERGFILSPTIPDIALNYHCALADLYEYQRAESFLRDAAAAHPCNKKIRYMLIDILIHQQNNEMAMQEIETAIAVFGLDDGILSSALKIREKIGPLEIVRKTGDGNTVSLCMIVKDEEEHLAKCLQSVRPVVDEIVVTDTGSSDRSREIARVFGAKVFDFEWGGDFAEARNYSLSKATGNMVFVMDADEVISPLDYDLFRRTAGQSSRQRSAFIINTRNYTMDNNLVEWVANEGHYDLEEAGTGWTPSAKIRLFPNDSHIRFDFPVHEMVEPSLQKMGIAMKFCKFQVHHYGKLNRDKSEKKGEAYYEIGCKKLEEMGDDPVALRELAIQAEGLKKHEEAVKLWERFIAMVPNEPKAYINMGISYCSLGQFDKVLTTAEEALKLAPDLKEGHFNCALAKLHLGHPDQAIEILEMLCDEMPEYLPARFILAAAWCCREDKKRGMALLKELSGTAIGPGLAIRCHELASRFVVLQRPAYALALLDAAIDSQNGNEDVLDLYADCLKITDFHQKTGTYE